MPDLRLPLTDKNLIGLPFTPSGQYWARDTERGGFFVLIKLRTKTFMIQADLRTDGVRRSIRMKVAEVGEMSARDARAKPKVLLDRIAGGEDPRPPRPERAKPVPATSIRPTLREAWDRFRTSHLERKERSANTLRIYTDHMERLFADWLDWPLSTRSPTRMVRRSPTGRCAVSGASTIT